ncbi:t-SNARE [Spinellus fusiger]|nr:t-SNARE [Spinellus fusiger]
MNQISRFSATRDRMAELRNVSDSNEGFGPARIPDGYRSSSPQASPSGRKIKEESEESRLSTDINHQAHQTQSFEMKTRQQTHSSPVDLATTEGYLLEVDALTGAIKDVSHNINVIGELHSASLDSINESQSAKSSQQLEQFVADTSRQNNAIKNRIKAMEQSNLKLKKGSDLNIRKAQVERLKKDFVNIIQRYQDVERTYSQKYRQRVERQIRIVRPDVTDEEIDAVIESDKQNSIFAQSLMQSSRSGQARAVINEVQSRHDDIKKIEKTIIELQQLFMDMQMLVENQGHVIDTIENNAESTANDMEQGVKHIDSAIKKAKATRAKKWCCFVIFIILCVVIAILIWWFAFNHKGVGGN